jgi:uncharacterized SAM-binding protein YcdF (DUF218 family)
VKKLILFVVGSWLLLLIYPAWLGYQIWEQSRRDELPRRADAIVVLGAAHYNGRPSPVLKARLDHAAYLYREGFSSVVIVTGGQAEGDEISEAEAGELYLESETIVAAGDVLAENEGRTTLESLTNVWDIAAERGIHSVLLVSDPLHSERIKRMASDLGFDSAFASPASYLSLNRSRETKVDELLHEVGSLTMYELFDR